MDKLESQGKYWKEILIGPNVLWKGLIISKLCNDSGFKNKINFVDNFYKEDMYEQKNISNYEKLKKIY